MGRLVIPFGQDKGSHNNSGAGDEPNGDSAAASGGEGGLAGKNNGGKGKGKAKGKEKLVRA